MIHKNHILFQGTLVKKKKDVLTENKREILWFNDESSFYLKIG